MNIEAVQKKRNEMGYYDMRTSEMIELIEEARKRGVDFPYELAILAYALSLIHISRTPLCVIRNHQAFRKQSGNPCDPAVFYERPKNGP